MSRISVFLNGAHLSDLNLEEGVEYFAGRSEENDIVLPKHKGISRKHIRFYEESGQWFAELTSRYGALIIEGESAEAIELSNGTEFQIPPFSFEFHEEEENSSPEEPLVPGEPEAFTHEDSVFDEDEESQNLPAEISHPQSLVPSKQTPEYQLSHQELDPDQATVVGKSNLIGVLKISYSGGTEEIVRLEGTHWTAGRDQNCEIFLNDNFVSRNHFEINKDSQNYYVRDLGSVNETLLNGNALPENEDVQLNSGNIIKVQDISITFEIRDENFNKQLINLPDPVELQLDYGDPGGGLQSYGQPPTPSPMSYPTPYFPSGPLDGEPGVEVIAPGAKKQKSGFQKNKIRILIGLLIPVILYGLLMEDSSKPKDPPKKDLASLSPEQQTLLKDAYRLATQHYHDRNFNLCIEQLGIIHSKVPFYNESKELEKVCTNAADLAKIEADRQHKLERNREAQAIIAQVVEECKSQMKPSTTMEQLKSCLSRAIELDPLNAQIVALEDIIQQREMVQKNKAVEKARIAKLVKKNNQLYMVAKKSYNQKNWKQAIKKYDRYLASTYPDPKNYKSKAKKELSEAKNNFNNLITGNLETCRKSYESEAFKSSIEACKKVLKIVPKHEDAINFKELSIAALNKQLKIIYDDSVLEESFGNTGLAMKKWKKIMADDIKGGTYYKKALSKLKKIGGAN